VFRSQGSDRARALGAKAESVRFFPDIKKGVFMIGAVQFLDRCGKPATRLDAVELMQWLRQVQSDRSTFGSGKNRLKQVEQLKRLSC
jgi:hypothetical protein